MKASELKLNELIEFSEGMVSLHGRRLVLRDLHAYAQFRKDLIDTLGWDQTRRIITRYGHFMGQADAAAMRRIFEWDSVAEWLRCGPRLHALEGAARTLLRRLDYDEPTGRYQAEVVWHDSGEAEAHLAEVGPAPAPICWILAGYASGYASFCLGKPVYFIEQTCRARGDAVCAAIGKDLDSWGAEIAPHLPFFQADDIRGKVEKLSAELRRKTRELARQRRQIGMLESRAAPFFQEVHSAAFRKVIELAGRIAPFDTSILITGETGVGKEVLARFIHQHSRRASGPFLGVNCGALPETLLESELFGHVAGAFTGAVRYRAGLFEQAARGTLFLDEIGEVSGAMQTKLLRVLQEREIMRVGESKPRKTDVRVIAATNRSLPREIAEGRFREDLFYRLGVVEIEIPPLRSRTDDILPLARYFVEKFSRALKRPGLRLDAACRDLLQAYSWPGNVRELENAIERAAVLSPGDAILPENLPPSVLSCRSMTRAGVLGRDPLDVPLADLEREHIQAVMERTGGNRTQAARALGISSATLWRKLRTM